MAQDSYIISDPSAGVTYDALLTSCSTCMENGTCPDCELDEVINIQGVDPDVAGNWGSEEISQAETRTNKLDRWPYQIISKGTGNDGSMESIGCDNSCVYLIRIQYKLETSSARRSFFQTGFSDIWLVERWNAAGVIQEMFNVATSLPFDYDNAQFASDYTDDDIDDAKEYGFTGSPSVYFNPYGLREAYDPALNLPDTHCGTLMFFARGDDIIKFRLAQHTNINSNININPQGFSNTIGTLGKTEDYSADLSFYTVAGEFSVKAYTRPIPGDLDLSFKASNNLQDVKYHPKLFS